MASLLLTFIIYDRRIVVFAINEVRSDIVVAVPADGILGTSATETPDHGTLLRLACPLKFLCLRLSMRQGFDGVTATYLRNLGCSQLLLSRARRVRTIDLCTGSELVLSLS